MILKILMATLMVEAALSIDAGAQTAMPDSKTVNTAPTAESVPGAVDRIPVKTSVKIEIIDVISSKTNAIGDTFALKLIEPLIIGGRTVLPAGLMGQGEVTHAAKRGGGGRAGELIVNARYLECGALRIPLGHFHYQVVGKDNVGGAYAASVVPFGQFLVSGHDAVIPAHTSGTAQVNADVVVSVGALSQCAPTG